MGGSAPQGIEKFLNGGQPSSPIEVQSIHARLTDEAVEIIVPAEILANNPELIAFEWGSGECARAP